MKLAVCARGEELLAQTDQRFGRCPYFVLVDPANDEVFESIRNENAAAAGGAGPQSAQLLANRGVDAVVTGNIGPKAAYALKAAGINIYTGIEGTVSNSLQKYKEGKLSLVSDATVQAHSGMKGGK